MHTVPVSFGKAAKIAKIFNFSLRLCGFAREKAQNLNKASYPEMT
jgi:hypothetical protein